ncbi:MAG: hypothetical protein AAF125_18130 [Chloroflexota bacterium]
MVQVVIQERQPAIVWEQAGGAAWVDAQGRVMTQREDRSDLMRINYEGLANRRLTTEDTVTQDVIAGALQLDALFPAIELLRYSPDYGLGFRAPEGWDVWFGTGTDMPDKALIYRELVADAQARGLALRVVSVAEPDAVYYATLDTN